MIFSNQDTIKISFNQDTLKKEILDTTTIPVVKALVKRPKFAKEDVKFKSTSHKLDSTFYSIPKSNESVIDNFLSSGNNFSQHSMFIQLINPIQTKSTNFTLKKYSETLSNQIQTNGRQNTEFVIFFLVFLGLVILSFISKTYKKYLNILFESTIFKFVSSKLVKNKTQPITRMFVVLDLLYFISFSLLILILLTKYDIVIVYNSVIYLLAGIFSALLGLRIFKYIVHKLILKLTNYRDILNEIYYNSLLFSRTASIVILPIIFLVIYSKEPINDYLLYFSLFIVGISLIMRTLRLLKLFIDFGFSIFYFILYLCALEFIPLLFFWKGLSS